jgi:heme exporter protein D
MTKHVVGMVGAVLGFLGGLWLILAPFAQGYQPAGASWTDATVNDFWVGIGLGIVSLIGLLTYALGLRDDLVARGIVQRRERRKREEPAPEPQPQGAYAPQGNASIEQAIVPLLNEMLKDMQRQREREEQGPNSVRYQEHEQGRSGETR